MSVDIQHDDLSHVRLQLVAPNGSAYTLVSNRVDAAGNDRGFGMTGTELGRYKGAFNLDTIFQDSTSRSILDGNAASPYSGEYTPRTSPR